MKKIKTITAILLGAATLAAAPALPFAKDIWRDSAIVAEAADTVVGSTTVGSVTYTLYRASNNVLHAEATGCYDSATSVSVPATVSKNGTTYKVTKIASNAFANRKKLTSVTLSNAANLAQIAADAFSSSGVQSVSFGGGIAVKGNAFRGCTSLKTLTFSGSSGSVTLDRLAFNGCTALQTIDFSCRSVSIYETAFSGCDSLSTVNFNSGVQSVWLESKAFKGMKSLSTVKFNNTNASLTMFAYTFADTPLSTLTLPNTVTTIPAYCFQNCSRLTNFSLPSSVTTIYNYAFKNAKLSSSFTIPKNVSTIANYAFYNTSGVSSYSVASGNTKFKSVSGVLYSADGNRLISYPQAKTATSATISASSIPDGTLMNNPYLQTLNISKYVRSSSDQSLFTGLTALKSITLPSAEFNRTGQEIMTRFSGLFGQNSKVTSINGYQIVQRPSGSEPVFHNKFASYLQTAFVQYENLQCQFMSDYINAMASYVVNTYTNSSMSQLKKAIVLHKWICDRTQYDPRVYKTAGFLDPKNHAIASVFLHKEALAEFNYQERYVSVCQGYSNCYKLLLEKAGIPAQYIRGVSANGNHAWNIIKLNGKWYHVDVTWDDELIDKYHQPNRRYENFLCPDSVFNADTNDHSVYNWYSVSDSSVYKGANVATDFNYGLLGDMNNSATFDSADRQIMSQIVNQTYQPGIDQKVRGDLNFDGVITQADLNLLNNYLNYQKGSYSRLAMWLFTTMET